MAVSYRLATPEDLPDIVSIYNQTIPSRQVTADLEPVTVESRLSWFHAHDAQRCPIWVVDHITPAPAPALAEGRLAAWLSFSNFHERPAYAGTAELSLYVHEACRGLGVGRYLLEQAMQKAPALGWHSLVGLIFAHNLPSLRLFAKAGFQTWGHLPRVAEMDGRPYDLIIVGKNLS